MSSFIRPIGVHRDINELEYISALLQSHPHILRHSGTIKPIDIVYYIKSRYGIILSIELVQQYIMMELGGQIHDLLQYIPDDEQVQLQKKKEEKKQRKLEKKKLKASYSNSSSLSQSHNNNDSEPPINTNNDNNNNNTNNQDTNSTSSYYYYIDICQLTSILLIPELVQEAATNTTTTTTGTIMGTGDGSSSCEKESKDIFQPFIDTIIEMIRKNNTNNSTTSSSSNNINNTNIGNNKNNPLILTSTVLRQLFDSVHEYNISNTVIQEMLQSISLLRHNNSNSNGDTVGGAQEEQEQQRNNSNTIVDVDVSEHTNNNHGNDDGGVTFDIHDIIHVLVHDVHVLFHEQQQQQYDTTDLIQQIIVQSTTNTASSITATAAVPNTTIKKGLVSGSSGTTTTTTTTIPITQINTAPFIDFSSDTYRRPLFGMQLWVAGIAAYFAYIEPVDNDWITTRCSSSTTTCNVAKGIASWLALFLQIVTLGLPYILLGSIGNANYSNIRIYRFIAFCIGSGVICVVTILSYFLKVETDAFVTTGNKNNFDPEYFCSALVDELKVECIADCYQNRFLCTKEYVLAGDFSGFAYFITFILGASLLLTQVVDTILTILPKSWMNGDGILLRYSLPGTVRQERSGKVAASYRMKQMLHNALDIAYDKSSQYHRSLLEKSSNSKVGGSSSLDNTFTKADRAKTALERFLLLPVKTEKVGGIFWAWKRIWDGTIFTEEGIWLNGRLLTCNFAQISIFGVLAFLTRVLYHYQQDFFYSEEEKRQQKLVDATNELIDSGNYTIAFGNNETYYEFIACSEEIMGVDLTAESDLYYVDFTQPYNFLGYIVAYFGTFENATMALQPCADLYPEVYTFFNNTSFASSYESDGIKDLVSDFEISPSRYITAAWVGLFAGFLVITYIAILLIPSFITTVMQFRSGVRGSLKDPEFLRLRYAMDTVTVLLGSAFWGTIITAVGAMFFTVGLIFLIGLLPLIIGAVLGFVIILCIRLGVLMTLRGMFFSALYRKRPGAANIMFIVLEVWNIALTLGFVAIRSIKLVVLAIMYIARIDTPFLARGIGRFGPVELDSISIAFEKDLLIHEAHRHILIERFGLLCLLKFYGRNEFATRAGSAWRLLFVLITMPWLQKYRVAQSVIDLENEMEQIKDDIEEELDVFVREEKLLQLQDKQSQMDIINAKGGSTSQEIDALRNRNLYLEEQIKILLEQQQQQQEETGNDNDTATTTTTIVTNKGKSHEPAVPNNNNTIGREETKVDDIQFLRVEL